MSASYRPRSRKEIEQEKKNIQKWEKEVKRLQEAERIAKDIADKYHKAKENQSPWATDRIPKDEIDLGGLAGEIYKGMKRAESESERVKSDSSKKPESLLKEDCAKGATSLSEKIGDKLRDRWKKRETEDPQKKEE